MSAMAKRGPHGTLRQISPAAAGETADAPAADAAPTAMAKRDDEYADHVVQTFRVAPSSTVKAEKKIVIPSREAETLKVRHEDVPALAAALARERARVAEAHAAEGLPVHAPAREEEQTADDTSWIDDRDSFDPESFSSEHPPPMASSPTAVAETEALSFVTAARRSRAGALFALLAVVVIGGGALVVFTNQRLVLPFGLGDVGLVPADPPPAPRESSAASPPTAAPADSSATRPTASPVDEEPIAEASAALSASAPAARSLPPPRRPVRPPREPQVYPDL